MNTPDHPGIPQSPSDDARSTRPLGFWLKTAERAIERELDALFDDLDVTPREWRLLNLIAGEVRDERTAAKLARRPGRVDALVGRGWAGRASDGGLHLTDDGRAMLATLDERVHDLRARVAGTVSTDDYATTLATLEAIARELGWSEDAAWESGRRGRGRWMGRRHRRAHGHGHPHAHGADHGHEHGPERGHGHRHGRAHHGHCGHRAA
ncbi:MULTISPECIES: MarR family winged helix-turn-helix transcriptional regulator [unclassified Agromyces]|uniref:MarR family winged helix-turn-helix transcriptional regulator n=1 Tax=unclassified Agromyces TaxID=2639701 RepID=UPI003015550E